MSNPYYTPSGNPGDYSPLTSLLIRSEFLSIAAGFDAFPTFTGAANRLVVVNSAGDGLTTAFTGVYGGGNVTSNAAYGPGALASNVTGASNVAVGVNALTANTAGDNNVAIGAAALASTLTSNNVGIGTGAGSANSSGIELIAIGKNALGSNTYGSNNVAVGSLALTANTNGIQNVAIGTNALYSNTYGNKNVAIGVNALIVNDFGSRNTVIGMAAAETLVTGSNNTLIGASADTIFAAFNSTALGYQATCTASNQIVLGNSSVTQLKSVGIAIPAGGTTGTGFVMSSTANFGVFFGSGAPSLSAAQGSLYLRSDGSATNNRAYINTNGGTTWTALTTAA